MVHSAGQTLRFASFTIHELLRTGIIHRSQINTDFVDLHIFFFISNVAESSVKIIRKNMPSLL